MMLSVNTSKAVMAVPSKNILAGKGTTWECCTLGNTAGYFPRTALPARPIYPSVSHVSFPLCPTVRQANLVCAAEAQSSENSSGSGSIVGTTLTQLCLRSPRETALFCRLCTGSGQLPAVHRSLACAQCRGLCRFTEADGKDSWRHTDASRRCGVSFGLIYVTRRNFHSLLHAGEDAS